MKQFLRGILLGLISLPALAATPTVVLTQAPVLQDMGPESVQQFSFTVKSNVPNASIAVNELFISSGTNTLDFTAVNDCNSLLTPLGTCTVTVDLFSHETTGPVNEVFNFNYGPRHVNLGIPLQFTISSAISSQLVFTEQPQDTSLAYGQTDNYDFVVSNTSTTQAAEINNIFFSPSPSLGTVGITDDCNDSLAPSSTCTVTLTVTAGNTSGELAGVLTVDYNTNNSTLTSETFTIGITNAFRTITFDNQCPFDVWIGISGGSTENINNNPGVTTCTSDADCFQGSTCLQTGPIKQCFWNNPQPDNDDYRLSNGQTRDVKIPLFDNGIAKVWGGGFAPRTGCTASSCTTADCGGGDGACTPTVGFATPSTVSEFTFQGNTSDFYDVTVINGLNLPMSVAPNNEPVDAGNPFTCGAAGGTADVTGTDGTLGGCSWTFAPPSNLYRYVADGGSGCTVDGDCGAEICGLSQENVVNNNITLTCGAYLGHWTANEVCRLNGAISAAPFSCTTNAGMPAPFTALTYENLYQCVSSPTIPSCYTNGVDNNCCGCVNWQTVGGIDMPTAPTVDQCVGVNPSWTTNIQPELEWTKLACPSAYTYPFDDKSSTFTCFKNTAGTNTANYTITFCPGGATGSP